MPLTESQLSADPIEQFLGSHPKALAFVQMPKPIPTSFARESYFSVTAYQFIDAAGARRHVRQAKM